MIFQPSIQICQGQRSKAPLAQPMMQLYSSKVSQWIKKWPPRKECKLKKKQPLSKERKNWRWQLLEPSKTTNRQSLPKWVMHTIPWSDMIRSLLRRHSFQTKKRSMCQQLVVRRNHRTHKLLPMFTRRMLVAIHSSEKHTIRMRLFKDMEVEGNTTLISSRTWELCSLWVSLMWTSMLLFKPINNNSSNLKNWATYHTTVKMIDQSIPVANTISKTSHLMKSKFKRITIMAM